MELYIYDNSLELNASNTANLNLFEYDNSLEAKYIDPADRAFLMGRFDMYKFDEVRFG